MKPKIVLIGNNTIAVNCLEYLSTQDVDIVAVIPEPSDNCEEGWQKSLKLAAKNINLNILQPKSLQDTLFLSSLSALSPDFIFSVQCRRILKSDFIKIPKYGVINLHFAYLPKYRGCYPIAWALINGEKEAGVSLHYIDEGIDTGDIIAQDIVKISSSETARQLFDKCTAAALDLFKKEFSKIINRTNKRMPQDNNSAIYYSINSLNFKDKNIVWEKNFISLFNWLRAYIFPPFQFPCTSFRNGSEVKVDVEIVSISSVNNIDVGLPGEIIKADSTGITVSALDGNVVVKELKVGDKIFSSAEFIYHFRLKKGDFFGKHRDLNEQNNITSNKGDTMKVNFVDLKKQYLSIKPEIDAAISRVLDNTSFILGSEVSDFEKNFALFCRAKHCVSLSSGTDALRLALKALGVGPGDEVITQANTFIATTLAISDCGATPVLIDCDPKTYNIDVNKIESAITKKTKVLLPVHLYGQTADMNKILELAQRYDLKVVEDACQAHGAEYKGRRTGTLGHIACFSFYPGKNLGAYGDGGAITTNDSELAEKILLLRDYGQKQKYHHLFKGYNCRLDSLQAAILNVKLKYIEEWNEKRRKNAALYSKLLSSVPGVVIPNSHPDFKHVYHLYVIRTGIRDKLLEFLKNSNIFAGIHYPIPIHLQKAYEELGYKKGSFPVTEKFADEILSLPMFPELTEEEIIFVVETIKKALSK
jgi:dTDP-4-amino-4,6-dideoxygalactose transaminase/methionyl-tRNA formyltransferase